MKWFSSKFFEKIKLLMKLQQKSEVNSVIHIDKQCPHCASRGMFVFNSSPKIKPESETSDEKNH
jgi:hypothetical protein